jgi:hypothetical protein
MRRSTLLLAVLTAAHAAGAPARPAEIAAARQLAREGFRLAAAGRCAEAVEPLTRAEALFHAPTTLVRLAECHLALGHLVLGTEELRRVSVEDLGPSPSKAFTAAVARARTLLAATEGRLGHLTLSVTGPDQEALLLQLDGEALSPAMVGVDIPLDPGTHQVRAEAPGFLPAEGKVAVAEGARERLELALAQEGPQPSDAPRALTEPPAAAGKAPPRLVAAATAAPAPAAAGPRVAAIVTLVVGVVGLGVGAGFGLAALGDKARLDAACAAQVCPASAAPDLALVRRDATLSTIGWALGGAAAATSLVLFLLPPPGGGRAAWLAPTGTGLVARW